jgi:cellulose synthase/poly-beta-1,6-N-acetylglucosamine synthase-like glycosyltransferase
MQDIIDDDLPGVSVLVPMHNEEQVADGVLTALLRQDYPPDRLEIIPIDDHSEDRTQAILESYAVRDPRIHPIYRRGEGARGKPAGLNEALEVAHHEVVLVFDADYQPPPDAVRELAVAFLDPEVGAVMGRVVPSNTTSGFLARLLDLERSGGYQVDQQARYSMNLVPQYGGTVGGFRRSVVLSWGGFDPYVLAEDTDLTFRLLVRGWRVAYANKVECYEEAPQTWDARFRQLRRWARGHTQTMFRHWRAVLASPNMTPAQRIDGLLLLGIYTIPPLILTGLALSLALFVTGTIPLAATLLLSFFAVGYNAFGNFAPFYQVGTAGILDGMRERLFLLPYLFFMFLFNSWAVTLGAFDAVVDVVAGRVPTWEKTARFRK